MADFGAKEMTQADHPGNLSIQDSDIPSLEGKVALVTGGANGIGLALAKLLLAKGATVHVVDLELPSEEDKESEDYPDWPNFHTHIASVSSWAALRSVFASIGPIHLVFANAGIADIDPQYGGSLLNDELDAEGQLADPARPDGGVWTAIADFNLRGVVYTVKLAHHFMRAHGVTDGSIVIGGCSPMYFPDEFVPVASVCWGGQLNLVRTLARPLLRDDITLNAVAAFATVCRMMPYDVGLALIEQGVPVSEAKDVALALAWSATAREKRRVSAQGLETKENLVGEGRWNGRVIQVVGDKYREIEEGLYDSAEQWFGADFLAKIRLQQDITNEAEG